jgi:DnaK suppressor protein
MDKKKVDRFKKQLLARREELLRSIAQTQEEGRVMQHSYGPDEGDRANSSLDKELLFTQTTHSRGLLGSIDAALARINDGTFGQCMVCEEEIGARRLEALPWTRYCISCQESAEKKR